MKLAIEQVQELMYMIEEAELDDCKIYLKSRKPNCLDVVVDGETVGELIFKGYEGDYDEV